MSLKDEGDEDEAATDQDPLDKGKIMPVTG